MIVIWKQNARCPNRQVFHEKNSIPCTEIDCIRCIIVIWSSPWSFRKSPRSPRRHSTGKWLFIKILHQSTLVICRFLWFASLASLPEGLASTLKESLVSLHWWLRPLHTKLRHSISSYIVMSSSNDLSVNGRIKSFKMWNVNPFQMETQGFRRYLSVDLKDPWSKSYHGRHEYKGLRALHQPCYLGYRLSEKSLDDAPSSDFRFEQWRLFITVLWSDLIWYSFIKTGRNQKLIEIMVWSTAQVLTRIYK